MKIDVLTVQGSPKNISIVDIYGRGVGGAELALLSWAEVMAKRGHSIRIYNQTNGMRFNTNDVYFMPDESFIPDEDRDILITFRGPNPVARGAKGKQIGWSCDQYSIGNYDQWYMNVEKMILISPFHQKDHLIRYGQIALERGQVIDLGVRTWEYEDLPDLKNPEKVPYSFVFCSVPDRGLINLNYLWPRIKEKWPEATLTITSDYTLWGAADPLNMQYRLMFAGMDGVRFLGNVERAELVNEQLKAEVNLYPCTYDENFCISIAECQVAGVYCVTTDVGALGTTNFTGVPCTPSPNIEVTYMDILTSYFNHPLETRKLILETISQTAKRRFDWDKIAEEWEQVFNG